MSSEVEFASKPRPKCYEQAPRTFTLFNDHQSLPKSALAMVSFWYLHHERQPKSWPHDIRGPDMMHNSHFCDRKIFSETDTCHSRSDLCSWFCLGTTKSKIERKRYLEKNSPAGF